MSRQLFAKMGVFALIVVNLGAYYFFWPDNGHGPGTDRGEGPGKSLQMASNASAAQPGDDPWKPSPAPNKLPQLPTPAVPVPSVPDPIVNAKADPIIPPAPPATPDGLPAIPQPGGLFAQQSNPPDLPRLPDPAKLEANKSEIARPKISKPETSKPPAGTTDTTKEQLKRLMEAFPKKDAAAEKPAPRPLPLGVGMLPRSEPTKPSPPPEPARPVKSVVSENSPWTLQWEITEGRTTLTARLNKRLEFRILCDRVKMETPDGAVLAVGKVSFTGPGMKGTCERLTIGLAGDTLTLDGKATLQIQQGSLADLATPAVDLKGEQFTLRPRQMTSVTPVQYVPSTIAPGGGNIVPANVNPSTPTPYTPRSFPSLERKMQ